MTRMHEARSNEAIRVVPYEQRFLPGLRALWGEHLGTRAVPLREAAFRWFEAGNPHRRGRPAYFVMLDGDRVIGMHGHMPVEWRFGHERIDGCMAHDDLLAGDCRGRGLGKVMLLSVAEQAPTFSGALWHNENNLKLYAKSGWTHVPEFRPYVKILDPSPFLRRYVHDVVSDYLGFPARELLAWRDRWRRFPVAAGIRVRELDRFDERVDVLFERTAKRLGMVVARTSSYLNWKFAEKPNGAYRIRVACDEMGRLAGYLVLKLARGPDGLRGRIVDLLVDPDRLEVFDTLLADACARLAAAGVSYIEIVCTYRPLVERLSRHGFIRALTPQNFMASNWQERFRAAFIGDVHSWYLTWSDADGDAWVPDVPWEMPRRRRFRRTLRA